MKSSIIPKDLCFKNTEEIKVLKEKINEIHKAVVGKDDFPGLRSDVRLISTKVCKHEERIERVEKIVNKLDLKMAFYAGSIAVIVFLITYVMPFGS